MTDDIFQLAEPVEDMLPNMKDRMPPESVTLNMSDIFKILSDHTRVKILYALSLSELCVADIAELAGVSQSAVSHQLRILRNSKLVTWKKSGKQVFYALQGEGVRVLIKKAMEHSAG
ncbi:MAG: ArsR/SmtB family transcription factor [Deferribacterales bacterium]